MLPLAHRTLTFKTDLFQLYWFGAAPPVLIIAFRLCLPETKVFRDREAVREAGQHITSTFLSEGRVALKRHWILLIYLVLLMAGFNFMVCPPTTGGPPFPTLTLNGKKY